MDAEIKYRGNYEDPRQEAACILVSLTEAGSKTSESSTMTADRNKTNVNRILSPETVIAPSSQDSDITLIENPRKSDHDLAATKSSKRNRNSGNGFAKTFPEKLMEILEYCSSHTKKSGANRHNDCASWLPHGNAFVIKNIVVLTLEILPLFFSNKNSIETIAAWAQAEQNGKKVKSIADQKYKSFTRKLYRWGFRQVTRGPDTGSYMHPLFKRHKKEDCLRMKCHYSTREMKTQRENAARAEERRKFLNFAKGRKIAHKTHPPDTVREDAESHLDSGIKEKRTDFNGNRSISKCNVLETKFRNPSVCMNGTNIVQEFFNSGNIISCKSRIPGQIPIHKSLFEDASMALADAVFRNKSIETVLNSQHEMSLRTKQAAILEQRAQSHYAAAAAAVAAASRLTQPNQLSLHGSLVNQRFEVNMYNPVNGCHSPTLLNNENMNIVLESRRQCMADLEKRVMLSNAFKQKYDDHLKITSLLRQKLHGHANSLQHASRNMDFRCDNSIGPRF